MHSFDNAENLEKKRDNWRQLQVFFDKRKIPIVIKNIDPLLSNEGDITLEFVKKVYTLLTERQLLPPIKIYETQQTTESYLLKEKEMVKLPRDELDFLKKQEAAGDVGGESKKESNDPSFNSHSVRDEPVYHEESSQIIGHQGPSKNNRQRIPA